LLKIFSSTLLSDSGESHTSQPIQPVLIVL